MTIDSAKVLLALFVLFHTAQGNEFNGTSILPVRNEHPPEQLQQKISTSRKKKFVFDRMRANVEVLREDLIKRGWEEAKSRSVVFDFKWTWSVDRLGVSLYSHQLINHYSNMDEVGTKGKLISNLKKLQVKDGSLDLYDFFPRAYIVTNVVEESYHEDETLTFLEDFERTRGKAHQSLDSCNGNMGPTSTVDHHLLPLQPNIDGEGNIWIAKPSDFARGIGIKLFNDSAKLLEYVKNNQYGNFVVQKYIERPLLVENTKFDLRQFVLVTSLRPLTIFIFKDCYLRFCTKNYTRDNLEDQYSIHNDLHNAAFRFIHLTNHQVQKNSDSYNQTHIPESQWPLSTFKNFLRETFNKEQLWDAFIFPKIERLVVNSLRSWPPEGHRDYTFELLGFDIMLDDQLNPYLLEINTNPGLHMLTSTVRPHHTQAQVDLLKVILDAREEWKNASRGSSFEELNNSGKFGEWKLIYKDNNK